MDSPSNMESLLEKDFNSFIDPTHFASSSQLGADFDPSPYPDLPPSDPDGCEFPVDVQHFIKLANDRHEEESPLGSSFGLLSGELGDGRCHGSQFQNEGRTRTQSSGRPRSSNVPLQQWYDKHRDYPYPSKEEKAQLAVDSGKSFKQVCEWFTNRRARQKHGKFLPDLVFG